MTARSRGLLSKSELAHEVLSRRLAGESADMIASDLEMKPKDVQAVIDFALEQRAEPIEGVRAIELGRLETLAAKFYEKASGGDSRALAAYVKVHDRIAKIAGLHQPSRVQVNHTLGHPMIDAAVSYEISPEMVEQALAEYARQSTNPLGELASATPGREPVPEAEVVGDDD